MRLLLALLLAAAAFAGGWYGGQVHLADCIRGWAEATTANPPAGIVSGTAEPAEVVRGLERDLRGQCTPWPFGEVGA